MKLCASYNCKNKCLAEVRYPITQLDLLLEHLNTKADKQISILEIVQLQSCGIKADRLASLSNENSTLVIDCYDLQDFIYLATHDVTRLMYHFPVNTYNDLWFLLQYEPYGISIREPLTFDLSAVRRSITRSSDKYIQIRVVPTIGRPSAWNVISDKDNGMRHFWIAPQMVYLYEPYIDVLDLYDADKERENALVQIYNKGSYAFNLNTIVRNCEIDLPCGVIDKDFTVRRLNCHQRCMELPYFCHYCDQFYTMAQIGRPSHKDT